MVVPGFWSLLPAPPWSCSQGGQHRKEVVRWSKWWPAYLAVWGTTCPLYMASVTSQDANSQQRYVNLHACIHLQSMHHDGQSCSHSFFLLPRSAGRRDPKTRSCNNPIMYCSAPCTAFNCMTCFLSHFRITRPSALFFLSSTLQVWPSKVSECGA